MLPMPAASRSAADDDRADAMHRAGYIGVDRTQRAVRDATANHDGIELVGLIHVIGVTTLAAQ